MSKETYPDDFERILSPAEIMAFASEIVWPAIDHIYGNDFRKRAQQKRKTRLPRKTRATDDERVSIFAEGNPRHLIQDPVSGDSFRVCTTTLIIDDKHPELNEGVLEVVSAEAEERDWQWWEDDIDWNTWESRTFYFSTDPDMPFSTYHSLEVHDEEELTISDRLLWDFNDADEFTTPIESLPRKKNRQRRLNKLNEKIAARDDEFMTLLSLRDCMEIRAALIRFGIPAEKMAVIE